MVVLCFLIPNFLCDDRIAEQVLVSTVATVTNAAVVSLRGKLFINLYGNEIFLYKLLLIIFNVLKVIALMRFLFLNFQIFRIDQQHPSVRELCTCWC